MAACGGHTSQAAIILGMSERTCSVCGNTYPLDKQHFRWRVQDGNGYFTAECLVCRKKQKKSAELRKKEKREASLRRIEEAGVDVFLGSMQRGGSNIPHSAEVIERVMDYFGGVSGFSAVMVKQYWDSPPGSSARNRLLETLCRLVSKNVEQGGAKKPLALWSDDELEQELNVRFKQAVAAFTGTTIDVETKPPEALPAPGLDAISAQAAEEASSLAASGHPLFADADPVPAGQHQGYSERTAGTQGRGPEVVPAEPESAEGA